MRRGRRLTRDQAKSKAYTAPNRMTEAALKNTVKKLANSTGWIMTGSSILT